MNKLATAEEILTAEAISRLRGVERLPHIGKARMPSLLEGTGRKGRLKGADDFGRISILENKTNSGSLRTEMVERVRRILQQEDLPVPPDDLHAMATEGLKEHAINSVSRAYLTNAVAWGLAQLVRSGEIDKLDADGRAMRDENGKIISKRASYYRIAEAKCRSN